MPFHSSLFLGKICFSLTGACWAPPLPCHAQDSLLGSPPRTMLAQRCCRLPLLTGGYRPGLGPPLFFHSRLFFLGPGWLSRSYWMLCRVGALNCRVYVGNCVHCSGLSSWCQHFSFLSDRVNGVAGNGAGKGHAQVRAVCLISGRPFPSNITAIRGRGGREPGRVSVRQLFRFNYQNCLTTLRHGQGRAGERERNENKRT